METEEEVLKRNAGLGSGQAEPASIRPGCYSTLLQPHRPGLKCNFYYFSVLDYVSLAPMKSMQFYTNKNANPNLNP